MPSITLYSRIGCSLCVEALDELERVQREQPFDIEEIDIDEDPALQQLYGEKIPVVTLDGRVIFEYFVDAPRLRELLRGGETQA